MLPAHVLVIADACGWDRGDGRENAVSIRVEQLEIDCRCRCQRRKREIASAGRRAEPKRFPFRSYPAVSGLGGWLIGAAGRGDKPLRPASFPSKLVRLRTKPPRIEDHGAEFWFDCPSFNLGAGNRTANHAVFPLEDGLRVSARRPFRRRWLRVPRCR